MLYFPCSQYIMKTLFSSFKNFCPLEHNKPLPGCLIVVLTRSRSFDIATMENVVSCESTTSSLELLAETPCCLSIEKVFVIGGGKILREALNATGCDAIHTTKIETSIECDTFIPTIDSSIFQPWYSSFLMVEKNIRYSFSTNVGPDSDKFEVKKFSFLPKAIFEKHEEFLYLWLVNIISDGTAKDDRNGTGTLSKFGSIGKQKGCQNCIETAECKGNIKVKFNLNTKRLYITLRFLWMGLLNMLLDLGGELEEPEVGPIVLSRPNGGILKENLSSTFKEFDMLKL
ncbi:hypothetical protein UlMin_042068 [Ulmus minor]